MRWHFLTLATFVAYTAQPVLAGQTYTPRQLRQMIATGNYPAQGEVETTVKDMSYVACIATLESIVDAIKPHYPSETVARTNTLRTEKLWTNDGAMTVTCSAANNRLVITKADYR